MSERDRAHEPVDGGLVCDSCGARRETPLGMARHRDRCERTEVSA